MVSAKLEGTSTLGTAAIIGCCIMVTPMLLPAIAVISVIDKAAEKSSNLYTAHKLRKWQKYYNKYQENQSKTQKNDKLQTENNKNNKLEEYITKAMKYRVKGQLVPANELLDKALKEFPDYLPALYLKIEILQSIEKFNEAHLLLTKLKELVEPLEEEELIYKFNNGDIVMHIQKEFLDTLVEKSPLISPSFSSLLNPSLVHKNENINVNIVNNNFIQQW